MKGIAADRATRLAYDVVAPDYARLLPDLTAEAPLDRALLAAFVEMVKEGVGGAAVVDVGCGSGRVTAYLSDSGLRPIGLDLSGGMTSVAHDERDDIPFGVAHAGALPIRTGTMAGLVAWYSLINLPETRLPAVVAEFARVLLPSAPILLAFQSGAGERVDRTTSYGHPVLLTYYRHRVADVTRALVGSAFAIHATVHRQPSQAHETTGQAFVLAHRG